MINIETLKQEMHIALTDVTATDIRKCVDYLHSRGYFGGVTKWQPIETAPENDLIVVTGGSYSSESTSLEFYCVPFKDRAVVKWNKYESQWEGCDCDNMIYYPTHWMPLPAAPEGEMK